MISGGTPGTKSVNVKFREIKLTKVMRNLPLFERDSNKWILRGESRKTALFALRRFEMSFENSKNLFHLIIKLKSSVTLDIYSGSLNEIVN